jgi:hypothetical protein
VAREKKTQDPQPAPVFDSLATGHRPLDAWDSMLPWRPVNRHGRHQSGQAGVTGQTQAGWV